MTSIVGFVLRRLPGEHYRYHISIVLTGSRVHAALFSTGSDDVTISQTTKQLRTMLAVHQSTTEEPTMMAMQQEQSLVPCVDMRQQQIESLIVPQQPQDEEQELRLYQKAFKVDFIGRRKKKSKQQVTWTFVRGVEEHAGTFLHEARHCMFISLSSFLLFLLMIFVTVMLTWSTQTGKVLLHVDGKEIHSSLIKGFSIIQRKVECRELGLHLEILASRTAPNHAQEDFLCHECIINGRAFSELPSVHENRLLMETNDGTDGRPIYVEGEGDSYSSSGEESDGASSSYMENLRSVVDIVYPKGIPPFKH